MNYFDVIELLAAAGKKPVPPMSQEPLTAEEMQLAEEMARAVVKQECKS